MDLRSQTVQALEKLARDASGAVAQALAINEFIRTYKLPIQLLDPTPVFQVQRQAEEMLCELEVKARRNSLPPRVARQLRAVS